MYLVSHGVVLNNVRIHHGGDQTKLLQRFEENYGGVSFKRYKLSKKGAKKAVQNARAKVYKEVYRSWTPKKLKRIYIELLE